MTELNTEDEIITVKLPREDYETLRQVIKREQAFSYLAKLARSWFVWTVASGLVALWALWDKIFTGTIK